MVCLVGLFVLAGCVVRMAPSQPAAGPEVGAVPEPVAEPPEREAPRMVASLHLTRAGRELLEKHQPDGAIRMLERAVGLAPRNGENYYYLARAWLEKGGLQQAREWHRLAQLYLGGDSDWSEKLLHQQKTIKDAERIFRLQ
ncbi:MAG: tetratricopeptide repeat protein [Deltaproteobacteria bacterium]|nr:tetratricopeptide repeat protein [Deltaproteobacteria bacterium]